MAADDAALALLLEPDGDGVVLLCPEVGLLAEARREGELLAAGADAGVLLTLGRARRLLVPAGVEGRVVAAPPRRARLAVEWGEVLYRLAALAPAQAAPASGSRRASAVGDADQGGLVFRSPLAGRFFLRPSPDEAPFVAPGASLASGAAVGLIEVMKTFTQVRWEAPPGVGSARVIRVLVADGDEIAAGDPLLELEPAPDIASDRA